MANVLLTTKCNLSCKYCFAQEKLGGRQRQVMTLPDVDKVIAFLNKSEHPYFRVMGGEPTLHPDFATIIEKALQAEMHVDVLSNVTWTDQINVLFRRISPRLISFLLNIDHPDVYTPSMLGRIERNLGSVSGHGNVTLSFNIFECQPRYQYVLDLAKEYGVKNIRMSFSLPVVGANNAFLKVQDYKLMSTFVLEIVRKAEENNIQVKLDNAVPLCTFTFEQAGELLMKGVLDFRHNARCEPIVDIGPDLNVWCCFCLSKLWNRHLTEFENLQEIQDYYRQVLSYYQCRLYPMDECYECRYRETWGCQGGCITHTIMRYGEPKRQAPVDADQERDWQPNAVLTLADDVDVQRCDLPKETYVARHRDSGLEVELDASFRPLFALLDGRHRAGEVIESFINNEEPESDSPVATFTRKTMRSGVRDLIIELLDAGLLKSGPG